MHEDDPCIVKHRKQLGMQWEWSARPMFAAMGMV